MISPCIQICIIDASSGLCQGCGRTLDEIATWGALNDADRAAILSALPGRLARPLDGSTAVAGRSDR